MIAAGDAQRKEAWSALVSLCEKNGYPLYAYPRRRRYPADQAQDLTQEFVIRVLEGRYLDRADREKGRSRRFLDLSKIFCGRRTRPASVSLSSDSSLTLRCVTANNRHGRL